MKCFSISYDNAEICKPYLEEIPKGLRKTPKTMISVISHSSSGSFSVNLDNPNQRLYQKK